ncbi:hypothetical protein G3578_20020 [Brevibacillus sp. SYP-B805]|uniref:imm11 family protein n=1 Tax=Brevibacillus sp. SYP-B805 TaxID=1578199 RepID=UPI0013E9DF1D|nr:DUF1629 domain-containing protein [Brevibacillus sp. SYP-B805]NGQ97429.1 hypothetical protein [Brevibacillus sp. SYP-B805]
MKIWKLDLDVNRYLSVTPLIDFWDVGNPISDSINRWLDTWHNPVMKIVKDRRMAEGDVFSYLSMSVCSPKVRGLLGPLVDDQVEWLPIILESKRNEHEEGYAIMHITNLVDGLDFTKAEVKYFPSDPERIMSIPKYAFREEAVKGQHIFRISQMTRGDKLVSDEFRKVVIENGITGWVFTEVWDSEKE